MWRNEAPLPPMCQHSVRGSDPTLGTIGKI